MPIVNGFRKDSALGRGRQTFTVPGSAGQYAPEILYCGKTPTGKSELLDAVSTLQALIESLPAGATVEVDALKAGADPSPNGPWVSVAGARGSNDKRVATGAFDYWLANQRYNSPADSVGVALPAGVIPINQWGGFAMFIDAAGAKTILAAPNNFTSGYANTGAALAAAQAIVAPANTIRITCLTIQTKVGFTFTCDTDALTGGASGNVANATNFTNDTAIDITANWAINVAAAMNSTGLKAQVLLTSWDGVRVRVKSGGTGGNAVVGAAWN